MTSRSNKLAIVGEAWGQKEEELRVPFVGTTGQELRRWLKQSGIDFNSCLVTNVFNKRPPGNKIELFCGKKADMPPGYSLPELRSGLYFKPEYLELDRLRDEIAAYNPNLILALGNVAIWALCQLPPKVSKMRGAITEAHLVPGIKVLPTYHPSAVMRSWDLHPIFLADLMKARREMEFQEIRLPRREIWLDPTLEDMQSFYEDHIVHSDLLAFDIETIRNKFITCIGFAPSKSVALVVPFVSWSKPGYAHWPTLQEEQAAWRWVKKVLESPIAKVGQNGLYDIQYLLKHGIKVQSYFHDTMLLHHSLQPELPKGLDFLGSIYTDEQAWKLLRPRGFRLEGKKDE